MDIKIAIIGGRLRGIEIAYLAKLAGIYTVLIDKDKYTPATGLSDEDHVFDVEKKEPGLLAVLKDVDIVIPSIESKGTLKVIENMCREIDIKVAFDFTAYDMTASRLQANLLMIESDLPHLLYYPQAQPPYLLKPTIGSSRQSYKIVESDEELEFLMSRKDSPESWVAQEFIDGTIYQVDVIGKPGDYKTYDITQFCIENDFDSRAVYCPADLKENPSKFLIDSAVDLAEKMQLTGIMAVEAVGNPNEIKLIELNAITPGQTPIALYFSSGVNMIVEILKIYADDILLEKISSKENLCNKNGMKRYVAVEYFQFFKLNPMFKGESNLKNAGPLKIFDNFFGSDHALTDYIDDEHEWQAVLINVGDSDSELTEKRIVSREILLKHCRSKL